MQGPSHLLVSWFVADAARLETARERRIVAWAGLAPDVDVVAYAAAIVYYGFDQNAAFENVWQVIHHRYTHGIAFVLLTGVAAWFLARSSRWRVALLAVAVSGLHNFLDVVGGGPTWPIYPLWPLSDAGWSASWSWTLADWPNHVVLFACLAGTMLYARLAARSPVEVFGVRADRWFVRVVRQERGAQARASQGLRALIWAAVLLIVAAVLAPLGFRLP